MRNFRTLLVMLLAIFVASCGSLKMPDPFHVNPNPLVNKGGKVSFTVNDTIPPKGFPKKEIVKVEPYLKYEGGSLALKPLLLKGEKAQGEGIVIGYKTGAPMTYTDVFDYKPEMQTSELWAKVTSLKGGKETPITDVKIASGIVITSTRVGRGESVQLAPHAYVKETIISSKSTLYFEYNQSSLNTNLKLNKDGKTAIDEMLGFLSKGYKIKDFSIAAWASPEGELTLNQELSDERGATAKKFIEERLKKAKVNMGDVKLNVTSKGADYDGFMTALNASNIEDKNTISNVIKSQANKSAREQQIRNMTVIYKEVEDMLSVLRRADFVINCYEPKRTDEQIAALSTTYVDSLTLEEILYAATLTQDLNTQLKIYKAAIAKNNQCWRAYNNVAAIDIKLGNVEEAAQFLEKASSLKSGQGVVENNMGVLAAWNKDYVAAKKHYDAAQAAGVDVKYNMGVIKMLNGDFGAAEAAFGSKTCDYNLALAQFENGKTAEATKTLDCSEKSGEVYYLLAVIGARTNNTSMVVTNLQKAIEAVPAYKNEAKKDKEFCKMKTSSDFQNLLN